MPESTPDQVLLVASEEELQPADRVWGTGGWLPPEEREALDWLTLIRFLGWGVTVTHVIRDSSEGLSSEGRRWIVFARDTDFLTEDNLSALASKLANQSILVIARAGAPSSAFARFVGVARQPNHVTGRSVRWYGPGPDCTWSCRKNMDAFGLKLAEGTSIWATLDGVPLIVALHVGPSVIATMAFHPSEARDADGAVTGLLRQLLIWGSSAPVAWFDWEGSLVLRMDDPGGAQNVHSRIWCYPKLGVAEWTAIGEDLSGRNARMSIGYVSGWVDDGDPKRGILKVGGSVPQRIPGQVYPSPLVRYEDLKGFAPGKLYDYEAEYCGLQRLRSRGLVEVELHGYTHMHPDSASWARASDRYEGWPSTSWYRELGKSSEATVGFREAEKHPLALGIAAFQRYFNVYPTTLISPGDQWTNDVLERALDLGLHLVSSYYLAIRDEDRFCWAQHVCAPYLDKADAAWFDAGLPVVGYLHDFDLVQKGVKWMSTWLDRWQEVGARRLIDFRGLAAAVSRCLYLEEVDGELLLTVKGDNAPELFRPIPVTIRIPGEEVPPSLSVMLDDRKVMVKIHDLGHGVGRITLPV